MFRTPEQAALAGIGELNGQVVGSVVSGNHTVVLVDIHPPDLHLEESTCRREDDRWSETTSTNGPGWTVTDEEADTGCLSFWDEVPAGCDAVRIRHGESSTEVPVQNGVYLFVLWDVPAGGGDPPVLVSRRVDGQWVDRSEAEIGAEMEQNALLREVAGWTSGSGYREIDVENMPIEMWDDLGTWSWEGGREGPPAGGSG